MIQEKNTKFHAQCSYLKIIFEFYLNKILSLLVDNYKNEKNVQNILFQKRMLSKVHKKILKI